MDMVIPQPLSRFRKVRTDSPDELRERLSGLFSVRSIELPRGETEFDALLNHHQMNEVGLSFARYGAPLNATVEHSDYFMQGFPLRGNGEAVIGRMSGMLTRSQGIVVGPGARFDLRYSSDFEHLIVRISPAGLARKLACLLGEPLDPPLRLTTDVIRSDAQFRLLEFVVGELDRADDAMPPLLAAEMEQAIIVSFLSHSRHNYAHRLDGGPREAAPWQVRRAEEYIRANWDKPVTIEALAAVANTSVRNLFHSFRKARGMSPMGFARRVRLAEARAKLVLAKPGATVTSIAFDCGFSNLGAFARYYQASYGELPSETLRVAFGRGGLRQ